MANYLPYAMFVEKQTALRPYIKPATMNSKFYKVVFYGCLFPILYQKYCNL
jgi:hypothetical protein